MSKLVLPAYWEELDHAEARAATSMSDLSVVALRVLKRMPPRVVEVCGPISTGGLGSMESNLARFRQAIDILSRRGYVVFDQMPFQQEMVRISQAQRVTGYNHDILHLFYRTIFRSGYIAEGYFITDWESSTGASWERQEMGECGIPVYDIPSDWFD